MFSRKISITIALAGAVLLQLPDLAREAKAYSSGTCDDGFQRWEDRPPSFRSTPFLPPQADWLGGIQDAISMWNGNPTDMWYWPFVQIGTADDPLGINTVVGLNNGETEVWATTDTSFFQSPTGGTFAAIGMRYIDGCEIVEGDVVFNANRDFVNAETKTDYFAYSGDTLSIEAVGVHEIGHTAGFGHVCDRYTVMGDSTGHVHANGDVAAGYPGEDVTTGLRTIYPAGGVFREDVAAAHWVWSTCDNNGVYGIHRHARVLEEDGTVAAVVEEIGSQDRYQVAAGQTVRLEFTYENLGESPQTGVQAGFYYSDDDLITTMDQRIGGVVLNLFPDVAATADFVVDLPADLPQGDGYFGVIVDENDEIVESNSSNNATYLPIRVDGISDDDDDDDREPVEMFQYAAKIVCGLQDDPEDQRLAPGRYATTVNIHNPSNDRVSFEKELALTYPPDEQRQGELLDIATDSLAAWHALEANCDDIRERVFAGTFPESYIEGFVVVTSPISLDVTAVYSSRGIALAATASADAISGGGSGAADDLGRGRKGAKRGSCGNGCCGPCCGWGGCDDPDDGDGNGGEDPGTPETSSSAGLTMDVEQIRERVVLRIPEDDPRPELPDLLPIATGELQIDLLPATRFCVLVGRELIVTIANQGAVDAFASTTTVEFTIPVGSSTHERATDPIDAGQQTTVAVPAPNDCFPESTVGGASGNEGGCSFRIIADSANPEDVQESNELNNIADGICFVGNL